MSELPQIEIVNLFFSLEVSEKRLRSYNNDLSIEIPINIFHLIAALGKNDETVSFADLIGDKNKFYYSVQKFSADNIHLIQTYFIGNLKINVDKFNTAHEVRNEEIIFNIFPKSVNTLN